MAKFFIDRPVFAIVIAIVIVLLGAVTIPSLPILKPAGPSEEQINGALDAEDRGSQDERRSGDN